MKNDIKRYILGIIIIIILLGICVNIDYAMNDTIDNTNNQTIKTNNSYVDFYNQSTITIKENDTLYNTYFSFLTV